MNQYTQENPPKRGNGRKIWKALEQAEMRPCELHYNPNNWGRDREGGYGSWGVGLAGNREYLCGVLDDGRVYLQGLSAPYGIRIIPS